MRQSFNVKYLLYVYVFSFLLVIIFKEISLDYCQDYLYKANFCLRKYVIYMKNINNLNKNYKNNILKLKVSYQLNTNIYWFCKALL